MIPAIAYITMSDAKGQFVELSKEFIEALRAKKSASDEETECNAVSNLVKDMDKYMVPVILTSNLEPCSPAPDNRLIEATITKP